MYRQIDTGTWDDPWFAELEPDAKLVFLYMLTNRRSTAAGVFEITIRAMAFETGLTPKRVGEVLELISSRVRWWPEYQTIWVRNFLRHQAPSPNLFKSAWNEMLDAPGVIRDEVGETYPLLTDENPPPEKKEDIQTLMEGYAKGSQGVPDGSRKTSLVKSRLEENSSLMRSGEREKDSPKEPPKFTEFYQAYPRKKARADALKAWKSIKPDDELAERIVNAAKTQAETTYKGKEQQYIPYPATWLRAGQWDDEIEDPRQAGDGTLVGLYGGGYDPLRSMPKEELDEYEAKLQAAKAREMERERGVG